MSSEISDHPRRSIRRVGGYIWILNRVCSIFYRERFSSIKTLGKIKIVVDFFFTQKHSTPVKQEDETPTKKREVTNIETSPAFSINSDGNMIEENKLSTSRFRTFNKCLKIFKIKKHPNNFGNLLFFFWDGEHPNVSWQSSFQWGIVILPPLRGKMGK